MAAQAEEAPVTLADLVLPGARQIAGTADQAGGVAVLEPPVAIADDRDQKQVTLHRQGHAEEFPVDTTNPRDVSRDPCQVCALPPGEDHAVAHAVDVEERLRTLRDLHRVVDEGSIPGRLVPSEAEVVNLERRERGRHPPPSRTGRFRPQQPHFVRPLLQAGNAHEHAGTVEIGMAVVHVRAAHRQVGIHAGRDRVTGPAAGESVRLTRIWCRAGSGISTR